MAKVSRFLKPAQERFETLSKGFALYDNYWQQGHMFDTMVDYLAWPGQNSRSQAQAFLPIALGRYLNQGLVERDTPVWYDDYSWWGIAGLKASGHPELFGEYAAGLRGIATYCWDTVRRSAPYTWVNGKKFYDKYFDSLEPRFAGGVWNYYWSPDHIPNLYHTPSDPINGSSLGGIQNTVTNGLFLVLTSRLYKELAHDDSGAPKEFIADLKKAVEDEVGFLKDWFDFRPTDPTFLYLVAYGLPPGNFALVRERVSCYQEKDGRIYPRAQGYNPDFFWAGDQGLIAGGLLDYVATFDTDNEVLFNTALQILEGTQRRLVDSRGLLMPYLDSPPLGDSDDYSTGTGVFMRYLTWAIDAYPSVRDRIDQRYKNFVVINADYVANKPNAPLTPPINPKQILDRANDLAVLTAALYLLPADA